MQRDIVSQFPGILFGKALQLHWPQSVLIRKDSADMRLIMDPFCEGRLDLSKLRAYRVTSTLFLSIKLSF